MKEIANENLTQIPYIKIIRNSKILIYRNLNPLKILNQTKVDSVSLGLRKIIFYRVTIEGFLTYQLNLQLTAVGRNKLLLDVSIGDIRKVDSRRLRGFDLLFQAMGYGDSPIHITDEIVHGTDVIMRHPKCGTLMELFISPFLNKKCSLIEDWGSTGRPNTAELLATSVPCNALSECKEKGSGKGPKGSCSGWRDRWRHILPHPKRTQRVVNIENAVPFPSSLALTYRFSQE